MLGKFCDEDCFYQHVINGGGCGLLIGVHTRINRRCVGSAGVRVCRSRCTRDVYPPFHDLCWLAQRHEHLLSFVLIIINIHIHVARASTYATWNLL